MNAIAKEIVSGEPLARLREPFPAHQVSKLPKETKAQADQRKSDRNSGVNCNVCGGWHHKNAVHLDYVGHAALTDRLLDTDPAWSWEPVAFRDGLPAFDQTGGLWIKLTVCGVTRLGYGHAANKPHMDPGSREKEVIGDALRNAAMRFGAALDLWHKGDLHVDAPGGDDEGDKPAATAEEMAVNLLRGCADKGLFKEAWEKNKGGWQRVMDGPAYARVVAEMKRLAAAFPKDEPPPQQSAPADDFGIGEDEIPF